MAYDKGADHDRWFDDLALGMRFKSADKLVTREDIKRFASEFDPNPAISTRWRPSERH